MAFEDLNNLIGNLIRNLANPTPIFKEVAVRLASSVAQSFKEGGRPEKWKMSMRAKRQGGQTLLSSGRLMKSLLTPQVTDDGITFGSNLPYAAIHQFGFDGNQSVRAHRRKVESRSQFGKEERISKRTGKKYQARVKTLQGTAQVKSFSRHMRMPARPFIVFHDEDMRDSAAIIMRHLL